MKSKLVKAYIIDDNRSSIDILKKMLEDNYSVEVIGTTTDAQEGLRGIEELSPDILFLDIEMPDISGLEVCSTLKDILMTQRLYSIQATTNTCSMLYAGRHSTICSSPYRLPTSVPS